MADDAPALIVVGRVRKPHGLKGELSIFPLTDEPHEVFVSGRILTMLTLGGVPAGTITLEAVRGYHREWLLKITGHTTREAVEGYREHFLAVPRDTL
ncbi:MAG: ribosome maturation factor RimM, partial [Gemmatimonadota bacterium]